MTANTTDISAPLSGLFLYLTVVFTFGFSHERFDSFFAFYVQLRRSLMCIPLARKMIFQSFSGTVENFLTYFTDFQKENSWPKISKIRKLPLLPTTCIGILVVRGGTQYSEQTGRKLLFTHERNLSSNFLM